MIRVGKPTSPKAQCARADTATKKEVFNMKTKKVWDEDDIYSLEDLLCNKDISEAMLGRAFAVLGIKGEELGDDLKAWKARIVFQGSNVHTKTGISAADLFEDVSNAPASCAAARAVLSVAALKGFSGSLCDAETAYLHALIDTPTRIPFFVELP